MSDFNSSLPVRTQTNGDVVIFIADATTPSQLTAVDTHGSLSSIIRDASGNAVTTEANGGQRALDVMTQNSGSVTGGTAANFSSLAGGQYNSVLPTLTTGQQSAIQLDSSGRIIVRNSEFPATVDTNYGTVGASTIRTASQIGNATGAADFNAGATGAQTLRVTANQGTPNTAGNAWPTYLTVGGTANSPTNPIFVTSSDTIGTPIDNYQTSVALAANASVNFDYTVSASVTFYTKQFWAAASGKIKLQVEYETAAGSGIFNTFWIGFNSTAETNILIPCPTGKTQVTGAKIRLVVTNLDKAAMDVYSTLSGVQQ
jgi:hypothetical protein